MKVSQKERLRGYYEYTFYEAIDDYNREVWDDPSKIIKVREAKALRKKFIENVTSHNIKNKDGKVFNASLDLMTQGILADSLDKTLEDRIGYKLCEDGKDSKFLSVCQKNYAEFIGFNKNNPSEIDKDHIYPITPYDDRFSHFERVFDNGSRLGGMSGDASISDVLSLKDRFSNKYHFSISDGISDGSNFITLNDLSGMSRLKPYIDRSEYYSLSNWVNDKEDFNKDNDYINKRLSNVSKACDILQSLSDEGRSYTISKDLNPGQIKANIDNTTISVRLTDSVENSPYIGRIYDNGASVRYISSYRHNNRNLVYTPDSEDIKNLIKFSLGEDVKADDYDQKVGFNGQIKRSANNKERFFNATYASNKSMYYTYKKALNPYGRVDDKFNNVIKIKFDGTDRTSDSSTIRSAVDASDYLKNNISLARKNFLEELGVENLIKEFNEHGFEEGYEYHLSNDDTIRTIQENYIDFLNDKSDNLLKVGVDSDKYDELYDLVNNPETNSVDKALYKNEMRDMVYPLDLDSESIIKLHAKDSVDYYVGNYDKVYNDKRFNLLGVSKYQGLFESEETIKNNLIRSVDLLNIPIDDLIADDDYSNVLKSQAIKFDPESARPMKDLDSPFMKSMFNTIKESLDNNGHVFDEDDITIDDNGVCRYVSRLATSDSYQRNNNYKGVEGFIGQIFEPDDLGVVYTKFAGDNNYAFVPGYEARILPQKDGERRSMEERTRLRGYNQAMIDNIRYRIRQDTLEYANNGDNELIGKTYSLNNTYSHLYESRHDLDFLDKFRDQGMSEDFIETFVKTEGSRVRYLSKFRDNSTVYAKYNYDKSFYDRSDDLSYSPFNLTDNRDISILTKESDGYFDPIMTTATSTNQGSLRYLVEGAKVLDDGSIKRSDDLNDRNVLMKQDFMKYVSHNPFDRQNMTVSNILQASSLTRPSKIVLTNFGGWNQDDGIVISKEFAEFNKMRGADGNLRGLTVGDKLSDLHGNKGVISLIVDRDMSDEEIDNKNLRKEVEWFRNNPDCEVVMAPFSAPSRFNGGTGKEMMSGEVLDVKNLDGSISKKSMGEARFIITDKAADIKTHIYDDEELMVGKGRKASSQMAWVYQAKGAHGILKECYGNNTKAMSDLREYLSVTGFDIDNDSNLVRGYRKHEGENRKVFTLPDEIVRNKRKTVNIRKAREDFMKSIDKEGGIMEIPFAMTTPSGKKTGMLKADKSGFVENDEDLEALGIVRKDGKLKKGENYDPNKISYGLPVLSSYLRSGVDLSGDERSFHDYTKAYASIYENALKFQNNKELCLNKELRYLKDNDGNYIKNKNGTYKECNSPDALRKEAKTFMENAKKQYDDLCSKIEKREFEGKHNIFRDSIMSKKMPDSATAIWSENPKNKLEEVSVSKSIANKIHVDNGDHIMIGRDPMLRDGACRYMKVKVDDSITGIAVNPCMAKSMDGDFDGDTIAIMNFKSKAAQKDGMNLFSMKANLLDYGSIREDGNYDLAFHDSLDIKVAGYNDPNLNERLNDIRKKINKDEKAFLNGEITIEKINEFREDNLERLNDFYERAYDTGFATATISYDGVENHLKSIHEACVETGAKGSDSKIKNYAKYFGCKIDLKEDETLDYDSIKKFDNTLATREEQMQTMGATAVKSFGTGLAGGFSQRAVSAGRDSHMKAMLELTYPVTQSLLQSKHNATEAKQKYNMLLGPARALWNGDSLSQGNDFSWQVNTDDEGNVIKATKDEWVNTFKQMYSQDKDNGGLNVDINPKYVEEVAEFLSDDKGKMRSIEDRDFRSSMDILSYGLYNDEKKSGFGYLNDLCDEKRKLFETESDKDFCPNIMKKDMNERKQSIFVKDDMVENVKKKSSYKVRTTVLRDFDSKDDCDNEMEF